MSSWPGLVAFNDSSSAYYSPMWLPSIFLENRFVVFINTNDWKGVHLEYRADKGRVVARAGLLSPRLGSR